MVLCLQIYINYRDQFHETYHIVLLLILSGHPTPMSAENDAEVWWEAWTSKFCLEVYTGWRKGAATIIRYEEHILQLFIMYRSIKDYNSLCELNSFMMRKLFTLSQNMVVFTQAL